MKDPQETPMMRQYFALKEANPDCILFFRMGDFYEMFYEDAKIGAEVMDIALTARDREKKVPMAGVPYHALDSYLAKMVKAGYKVAICEQMTEPGSGLVEREVVRVVSPGTILDEKALERGENNYLMSLQRSSRGVYGLAFCDLSTGAFVVREFKDDLAQVLADELIRFAPTECILPDNLYHDASVIKILKLQSGLNIYCFHDWTVFSAEAEKILLNHFGVKTLAGFGLGGQPEAVKAAAVLLSYLKKTQRDNVAHLKSLKTYSNETFLLMDRSTIINLELLSTLRDAEIKGSLLNLMSETSSALGARSIKDWLLHPLVNRAEIEARLEVVEYLHQNKKLRDIYREELRRVADIERLLARLASSIGNARDLVALKNSLQVLIKLIQTSSHLQMPPLLSKLLIETPLLEEVVAEIETNILEDPPFDLRSGDLIKEGVSPELDDLRQKRLGGRDFLVDYEKKERAQTGIGNLKVRNNSVFGFYIEITKSNLSQVPPHYVRKQTLVNAERFITPELKEYEEIVLRAQDRCVAIEYEIYQDVLGRVLNYLDGLQKAARRVAALDGLLTFAHLAVKHNYTRPVFSENTALEIKNGRHPVVEKLLEDQRFVPNDTLMDDASRQLILLTGPNMAGKSVYMRQTALIVLMAQMGSFVPASSARLPIFDRLFVRSGAADIITANLSTFMVEMVETANILNHATSRSLIVLDEIGRGTSTYDGLSLAWAIVEYLVSHPKNKPLTLFSTHYHEMQVLAEKYEGIVNEQVLVEETKSGLNFLHKVAPGGASHSYGIAVAQLAGVPEEVVSRAQAVLKILEAKELTTPQSKLQLSSLNQLSMIKDQDHPVLKQLHKLKPQEMTPLEALQFLTEIKTKIGDSN